MKSHLTPVEKDKRVFEVARVVERFSLDQQSLHERFVSQEDFVGRSGRLGPLAHEK